MSKGSYRGRPLESYSKEELIDIVVEAVERASIRLNNRTSQQREDDDYRDMAQRPDGVWAVNERD